MHQGYKINYHLSMHKDYTNLSQNLNWEVFQSKQTYDYHGIDIRFCMIMMIKQ